MLPWRKNETPTPRATILVRIVTLGVGFGDLDATLRPQTGYPLTILKGRLGERVKSGQTLSPKRPLQISVAESRFCGKCCGGGDTFCTPSSTLFHPANGHQMDDASWNKWPQQ